jgi:hypothetical protein
MTTYGLTVDGWVPKTLEILRAEYDARLKAKYGPTIAVDDESVEGQFTGMTAEQLAILWEVGTQIVAGGDPDMNTGYAQDAVASITGTFRRPASKSAVVLTLTGDDGTEILPLNQATSEGVGGPTMSTSETATLELADPWVASTVYAVGDFVSNDDAIYVCTDGGVSAGSGGPTSEDDEITDGGVEWRWVGAGLAYDQVASAATETGPKEAASGTIVVRVTSISGWLGVMNLLDVTPGADVMTHEQLRVLREREVATPGTGTIPAIQAALLEVGVGTDNPVTHATVFYNNTDLTVDGIPPHRIECLVQGGEDQDIFDALFDNIVGGIRTFGTVSGTHTDSEGTEHDFYFSRPEEVFVYIEVALLVDPDTYPDDGDDQVKLAIVAWGDAQLAGKNAVSFTIGSQALPRLGRDGALPLLSVVPGPTLSTTIQITNRQLAVYDTSRIEVTTTEGTP